ncbi:prepilin peptidase [Photorhabdus temperata]|nr:prepilin peptidase [Photorhabdus temperata]
MAFSIVVSKQLPAIYMSVKLNVISDSKRLEDENRAVGKSFISAIFCLLPSILIFYLSNNICLSGLIFLLGCIAYTDLMARWIPDCLIYSCLLVSLFSLPEHREGEAILSIILFLLPAGVLQIALFIKQGVGCIASGDFYIFPAIAVWLAPESSAPVMLTALGLALVLSRIVKEVPFITCLFSVFVGYQICVLSF